MFRFYKTLPSLNGLIRTNHHQTAILRTFTSTPNNLKKSSLNEADPDAEVILLSNNGTEKRMKYSEVLEKVGGRNLVKIKKTKGGRHGENQTTSTIKRIIR